MTYVPFRMDGRLISVKKKKKGIGFQKYKYNKITSIKGKKKEDGASEKKLRMKRKTNYTEKRKNKQTITTTTENTKTRTHRMQNIMRITCAIVLQPIFNAYIFKGSTNFQRLLESPVLYFFRFPFFSHNACVPVPSYNNNSYPCFCRFNIPFAVKRN